LRRCADFSTPLKAIVSRVISAIHRSHRVSRHAATASHFSHDGDSRKRQGADSESTDYNEIQHFRHSVLMVGVNTA
jgi:hypothetical protein